MQLITVVASASYTDAHGTRDWDTALRLVMIKQDQTVLLCDDSGVSPLCAVPRATVLRRDPSGDWVFASSSKTLQLLVETVVEEVSLVIEHDTGNPNQKQTHITWQYWLQSHPTWIDPGIRSSRMEVSTPWGAVDWVGWNDDQIWVVELKTRKASLNDVSQLHRYVQGIQSRESREVVGILIAPSCSSDARRLLDEHHYRFRTPRGWMSPSVEIPIPPPVY